MRSSPNLAVRVSVAAGAALAFLLSPGRPARAQSVLRFDPPVQHVAAVRKGELLIGLGASYAPNIRFTLLDLEGDLTRIGIVDLAYALADGVLVELRTDLYRAVTVDRIGDSPPVEPDEGLADGKSTGAGNARITTLFRLLGDAEGWAGGLHLEFTIPSDNQSEGLGTNSTDVRVSGIVSYARGPLRFSGDAGVAILEAPLESFEQNDVFVYSAEILYRPAERVPARVYAALDGRVSTRKRVPLGTEDVGEVLLGADYTARHWLLDLRFAVGFEEISPDWQVSAGVARILGSRTPR